ncbi:hypothetical protein [Burkholderia ubonensis]|uniref:hypothetical protein n=1 Tax=Burkholderia ubonensis TaxID=101571 RepID=UPI000A776D73|nr:hypothetical protein [Burkholderia ubonensis]
MTVTRNAYEANPPAATPSPAAFREAIEAVLLEEAQRYRAEVPRAGQLADATLPFDTDYYIAHRIETVHRIRLTARTDALALQKMLDEDYDTACRWGDYIVEEMKHDRMFLADLATHGYRKSIIDERPPLKSTRALLDYLEAQIHRVGSVAAVSYSIFVEWNSARFSRAAIERAAAVFGERHVRGANAHLRIDEQDDHYAEMVEIAYRLTAERGGAPVVIALLREIASLLRATFVELHALTAPAPAAAAS